MTAPPRLVPHSVQVTTTTARITLTMSAVSPRQCVHAAGLLLAFTAAIGVLLLLPAGPVALAVAVLVVVSAAGLVRLGGPTRLRITAHLLDVDGVGQLPLAAIHRIGCDGDGRLRVHAAQQTITLPGTLGEGEVEWLRDWLDAAAQGARERLRGGGEDPHDCRPPAELLALCEVAGA